MKILNSFFIVALFGICFLSFASAVPQVIFTNVNLTITNGTYTIIGEGINAQDTFSSSCQADYHKYNIPITFSREINQNDTDVAILIRSLAQNLNVSDRWEQCVIQLSETNSSLQSCQEKAGYQTNFTQCQGQLNSYQAAQTNLNQQLEDKNSEIEKLKSNNQLMLFGLIIAGIAAIAFYRKSHVKTTKTSFDNLALPKRVS